MTRALQRIAAKPYVAYVEDEREAKNGIFVGLRTGYEFVDYPDHDVRNFATVESATRGTAKDAVRKVTS